MVMQCRCSEREAIGHNASPLNGVMPELPDVAPLLFQFIQPPLRACFRFNPSGFVSSSDLIVLSHSHQAFQTMTQLFIHNNNVNEQ